MSRNNLILAVIPARSGSKSVKDKNIREFTGKPLMVWSIEQALASDLIDRVIVSTDSSKYADIARDYGADVPFLRPMEIARDDSTDLDVFINALEWLRENENYFPDICVHLRPTYPIRRVEDINKCIQILLDNNELESVRSVAPSNETPYKMWFRGGYGLLSPVVNTHINEAYNMPRQQLPSTFVQNACIDVVKTRVITEKKSMTGTKIYGYLMVDNYDIDTENQLLSVEHIFNSQISGEAEKDTPKTFCFDIDGVIAKIVSELQYDKAEPVTENISLINNLYDRGHTIILYTARGSKTGIDWKEVTKNQMKKWGVHYHELHFGKPAADYYIDDKFVGIDQLKEQQKKGNL